MPLVTLQAEVSTCTKCLLGHGRTQAVFGRGPIPCDLMFVGEAPGGEEDLQGEPFVGPAGRVLANLMKKAGIKEAYITNLLKCRPRGNRDPEPEEIQACRPYLEQQILAVQPRVLVALGRFAAANLSMTFGPISSLMEVELHWRPMTVDPSTAPRTVEGEPLPVVALFHPAYFLRLMQADRGRARVEMLDAVARLRAAHEEARIPF